MKKFQTNINRELRRAYPDRRRLETQCLSVVSFVRTENEVLDCPIWVLVINVVAMDMLKSKLPAGRLCESFRSNTYIIYMAFRICSLFSVQRPLDIKNRPRIPIPDEDPYSVAENVGSSGGSSGSSGLVNLMGNRDVMMRGKNQLPKRSEKPPKLPPRDIYPHDIPKVRN